MEFFWSTLKLELVYRRNFATRAEARREIVSYLEGFYNSRRRHRSLDFLTPAEMPFWRANGKNKRVLMRRGFQLAARTSKNLN